MTTPNRFIVVDDDPLNNLVCNHIILKVDPDAKITLFTNPEKALEMVQTFGESSEKGDFVLFLDVNMPSMSGWEFLDAFESLDEKIHERFRIYMLSSSIDQGDIEKAAANPFVRGYYPKPLSFETMGLLNL
ncbi:response regulator [Dyadobacter fanqingshengii]|uniref:Response regulator n=1 Tax=Dyadobacter fanqingshengii TaxID=2906443 RepID=A0A9X1PAN1_9BACT|nr:response regulator [Dyadobacter fanqingshengii]MCF0041456.1 response regulator [Dyadobacter fanqingshengii]USJ36825.1 response regulator [Dyadobacter fanqingshengii]